MSAIGKSLLLFIVLSTYSLLAFPYDSAQQAATKNWSFKSNVRLHSKGMFAYGGRIGSPNPAFDINFIYTRKQWGFLAFKALDLKDRTSPNNFTLAVFYRNFKLSDRLTITPYAGAFLEQQHRFAGHGSDVALITTTIYKISPTLSADYTVLFANMMIEPELRDWVNRMRILYSNKHLDIAATVWHNNRVLDENNYLSSSFQIAYSRIRLSNSLNLSIALTELSVLHSSNERAVAKSHQCLLSVAVHLLR